MVLIVVLGPVRIYRDAVAATLDRYEDLHVVAVVEAFEDAVSLLRKGGADVVLADATTGAGVRAVRALSAAGTSAKVVAVVGVDDGGSVIACAEAGVAGVVTSDGGIDEVVAAVLAVARGESACSPSVAAMLHRVTSVVRLRAEAVRLTRREREILILINDGLSNKEIATGLGIEVSTVKNHVHNILEKLGARRRSEAVARARELINMSSPPVLPVQGLFAARLAIAVEG